MLDRKPESLALLKGNAEGDYVVMVGGYYRPSTEQKSGEVGFLAIFQSEHVRGCGTRLFARTKEREETKAGISICVGG